jgi:hypothetical protein
MIATPRFLRALACGAALAAGCTTTLVPFDPPTGPTGGGGSSGRSDGGLSDGDASGGDRVDGAAEERSQPDVVDASLPSDGGDAVVAPVLPASPSFEEAFAAGPLTGNGGRYVEFKCCSQATSADCITRVLGTTISCVDVASWKSNGSAICESMKLALWDYAVYGDCSRGGATSLPTSTNGPARFAEFKCCLDGAICTKETRGRSDLCFDGVAWNALVKASCDELGGQLQGVNLYGPC